MYKSIIKVMKKQIIDIYSDCCNAPSNSDSQRCSECGEICEPLNLESNEKK